jgi:hypothetical protein
MRRRECQRDQRKPMSARLITGSFEATRDARGAARHDQVTVNIKYLKRNCIGELILLVTQVDDPGEPVCLRPGSRSVKNERLRDGAVSVVTRVPPDTQTGSC